MLHLYGDLRSPVAPKASVAHSRRSIASSGAGIAAFLALVAVVIRLPNFGDPNYHIDESFYLFVGQRMHEGFLPVADLWDRKPAGLFFLYSLMAQFGGVYAYQAIAALFAWATAFTLALIATRFAGRVAAAAVGVVYLALIGALAGGGGQSPVYYNLFVALAALLVLRQALGETSGKLSLDGTGAMLLCGLALTIKPTALMESIFFGLVLLALHLRQRRSITALAIHSGRLAAAALVPTGLIWAFFYAEGSFHEYWFATMQSIFLTEPPSQHASAVRLTWLAHILWLPTIMATGGMIVLACRKVRSSRRALVIATFVGGWLTAAITGFLLIPNFYDHYALPVASVVAIASAPVFDRRGTGPLLAVLTVMHLLVVSGFPAGQFERKAASQAGFTAATEIISRHAGGGCIFVYDATPALYRPFEACPANRFAFPEHLSNQREAGAIGVDPLQALKSVLTQSPSVIVTSVAPSVSTPNLATRRALEQYLERHYQKVGEANLVDVVGRQQIEIWKRNSRRNSSDANRGLGKIQGFTSIPPIFGRSPSPCWG